MRRHKSFEAFLASALVDAGFINVPRFKKALDKIETERIKQDARDKDWRKRYQVTTGPRKRTR